MRTAAITGGARGIGAATADALTRAGYQVVVGDLDSAQPLDVTDRAGFTKFLDEAEGRLGPLDVLINNAGIMPLSRIEDEPDEVTARILATNLHATIHGTREAVTRMRPRGHGHIVNVASVVAKAPGPGAATYAATKAGVLAFSAAVRAELRGSGVAISCVLPGLVATDLSAGISVRGYRPISPGQVAEAIVRILRKPRPETYVPARMGAMLKIGSLFGDWPQRMSGADDAVLNAIGADERAAYERRAR